MTNEQLTPEDTVRLIEALDLLYTHRSNVRGMPEAVAQQVLQALEPFIALRGRLAEAADLRLLENPAGYLQRQLLEERRAMAEFVINRLRELLSDRRLVKRAQIQEAMRSYVQDLANGERLSARWVAGGDDNWLTGAMEKLGGGRADRAGRA